MESEDSDCFDVDQKKKFRSRKILVEEESDEFDITDEEKTTKKICIADEESDFDDEKAICTGDEESDVDNEKTICTVDEESDVDDEKTTNKICTKEITSNSAATNITPNFFPIHIQNFTLPPPTPQNVNSTSATQKNESTYLKRKLHFVETESEESEEIFQVDYKKQKILPTVTKNKN